MRLIWEIGIKTNNQSQGFAHHQHEATLKEFTPINIQPWEFFSKTLQGIQNIVQSRPPL